MEYATRERFGGLGLKTIGGRFHRFGPQNPSGGFEEERTARGSIEEFASRRIYLMKGVGSSDASISSYTIMPSDYVVHSKYLRTKQELCNSPVK